MDDIQTTGTVVIAAGADIYSIQLSNGNTVIATLSARMKRNRMQIREGDTVEITVSDLNKRITNRLNDN